MNKSLAIITVLLALVACSEKNEMGITHIDKNLQFADISKSEMSVAKKVYLPIYSTILVRNKALPFELTSTLIIRNINLTDSIFIFSAKYYNTKGVELKEFVPKPILMHGLESIDFFIDQSEERGGMGANFIVEWGAINTANNPIIQSLMVSTAGQQGISFICDGVEIND